MKGIWAVPVLAGILIMAGISFMHTSDAEVTEVLTEDVGTCDPMDTWFDSDEIGFSPPFSTGEVLTATSGSTGTVPCVATDLGGPHALVSITNMNTEAYEDVYYVADFPDTVFTNIDGTILGIAPPGDTAGDAFRIDAPWSVVFQPPLGSAGCGVNCPLVSESLVMDGIWEPTETWEFVIQDYVNGAGTPSSAFGSIGVTSTIGGIDPGSTSSGSILVMFDDDLIGGTMIPIDTTALLVAGFNANSIWMIPTVLGLAGAGIVLFKLKRK